MAKRAPTAWKINWNDLWQQLAVAVVVTLVLGAGAWFLPAVRDQLFRAIGTIPAGAVMTFDMTTGCPAGWTDLGSREPERFAGRVIVGAGTTTGRTARMFRDGGGSEQATLRFENIPPHTHPVISDMEIFPVQSVPPTAHADMRFVIIKDDGQPDSFQRDATSADRKTVLYTDTQRLEQGERHREATPFSLMPPYTVLYLCRKD
jgi:hypothetical protein